jgi:putative ATPase
MRPTTLDEIAGQTHLIGRGTLLRRAIETDQLASMVLWGPPGTGKTTLARVIAAQSRSHFVALSAVAAGVADLRREIAAARDRLGMNGDRTILFIDEIHRFNKAQQDAILPHVEEGIVVLIGATTENPSFEVNSPLLSRSRVLVLNALDDEDVQSIIERALEDEVKGLGARNYRIEPAAMNLLVNLANGDARFALNTLEYSAWGVDPDTNVITESLVKDAAQRRASTYDKSGDDHFDAISALHKTMRGSDVDAALYWLARMLSRGDDPRYILRRLVRFASEDIGLADPQALSQAVAAQQAYDFIGLPEGALALAQAVAYLALAPKSNALYMGYGSAATDVDKTRNEPVPTHLRNAPTGMMKELGYGSGYRYAHDFDEGIIFQQNRPQNVANHSYYQPTNRGNEALIQRRMEEIRRIYAETASVKSANEEKNGNETEG